MSATDRVASGMIVPAAKFEEAISNLETVLFDAGLGDLSPNEVTTRLKSVVDQFRALRTKTIVSGQGGGR